MTLLWQAKFDRHVFFVLNLHYSYKNDGLQCSLIELLCYT